MKMTLLLFFTFLNAIKIQAAELENKNINSNIAIKIVDFVNADYTSFFTFLDQKIEITERNTAKKYFLTQNGNLIDIEYNNFIASVFGKDQSGKITIFKSLKKDNGQIIRGMKLLSLYGVEIQLTDILKTQVLEKTSCEGIVFLSPISDRAWSFSIEFNDGCKQNL